MGVFRTYKLTGVDFDSPSFKMVGGMSLDDIKIKYSWFLNASVKDAIIGEDENGLVWYAGEFLNGVWENGTWYSGIFHTGRWKSGDFYSYDIDLKEASLGRLLINQTNISKSQFLSGRWEGGSFHYGIMGKPNLSIPIPHEISLETILTYNTDFRFNGDELFDADNKLISRPIFEGGVFVNGWANGVIWDGGEVEFGYLNNIYWKSGDFKSGVFLGDYWISGNFFGGDFSNGVWENGTFTILKNNIKSRFGVDFKLKGGIKWLDGVFENGELHSRLTLNKNGESVISISNQYCEWKKGLFKGGVVFGINWKSGTLDGGLFKNGYAKNIIVNNGAIENIYSNNIIFNNGECNGGFHEYLTFNGGKISFES